MVDFETQWANAMRRAKQQRVKQKAGAPLAVQEKQNKEEMDYFKQKLLKARQFNDRDEVKKTVDILIKLRAKTAALKMQKAREISGFLSEFTIKKIVAKYTSDCARLLKSLGY